MERSSDYPNYEDLLSRINAVLDDEELTPYQVKISLYLLLGKDPEDLPGSQEWIKKQIRYLLGSVSALRRLDTQKTCTFVNCIDPNADKNGVFTPNSEASLQKNGVFTPNSEASLQFVRESDQFVRIPNSSRPRNPSKRNKKNQLIAQKVSRRKYSSVYVYSSNSNLLSLNKIRCEKKMTQKQREDELAIIKAIIDDLNALTGKNFRSTSEATKKVIRARLGDRYTLEDFKTLHRNQLAAWKGTRMEQFLRPETLYRPSHFESYLNNHPKAQIKTGMAETNSDAAGRAIRKDHPLVNPRVRALKESLEK